MEPIFHSECQRDVNANAFSALFDFKRMRCYVASTFKFNVIKWNSQNHFLFSNSVQHFCFSSTPIIRIFCDSIKKNLPPINIAGESHFWAAIFSPSPKTMYLYIYVFSVHFNLFDYCESRRWMKNHLKKNWHTHTHKQTGTGGKIFCSSSIATIAFAFSISL